MFSGHNKWERKWKNENYKTFFIWINIISFEAWFTDKLPSRECILVQWFFAKKLLSLSKIGSRKSRFLQHVLNRRTDIQTIYDYT